MKLENLTKKNQEFIKIATHQLIQDGKSDAEIKTILEDVLPQIEENQKKGIPARTFLGAPTVWAGSFTPKAGSSSAVKVEKNTNPWLMWLDTTLLFLGAFSLLNAVLQSFNKEATSYGILTLLILTMTGGAAMYAIYYFVYRHINSGNRPHWAKSTGILFAVTSLWLIIFTLASVFIPASINPILPPLALAIIGTLAFGARYFLQKKYNVANALSVER
ncbi:MULTISPECIES: DUF1129 domain-containing protein [Streptococcus]|uniref:DUF1129 domain-containing protein n=1 Tax=Streptococcus caledonicus TaxID=2614158 RepID=A0ABW0UGK2_9STRE|nr:DUF1129 family protein [Streptococcus sp. S784/96/1]